jgi:large subunit ribosomal protein L14e
MIEIGRLCLKTAGRDSGGKCVIIDIVDDKYVMIDGETRRRKCNVAHLEPLKEVVKISKGASHEDVKRAFKELGLKVKDTKPKEKKEKPLKQRGKKKKKAEEGKKGKKAAKKEVKKEAKKEPKKADKKAPEKKEKE